MCTVYNRCSNAQPRADKTQPSEASSSECALHMPKRTQLSTQSEAKSSERQRPPSASNTVFVGIVRGLEKRVFVPSQRLVEADLAEQFKVGRNSVREALQRLAAEGIVELNRHRGASIRSLTMQETRDVLEVAELLTGLLGRAAARNAKSSQHIAKLRVALSDLTSANVRSDTEAFSKVRRNFYRSLLDIAANQELNRLFPAVQMHIVHAQYRPPDLLDIRTADYARLGAAVLAGDLKKAEAAGIEHVRHVREAIERLVANAGSHADVDAETGIVV